MEDNNGNANNAGEEKKHLPCLPVKPLIRNNLVSKQWSLNTNSVFDHIIFSNPFIPIESLFIQSGNSFYLYSCTNIDDDENVEVVDDNTLVRLNVDFEVDCPIDEIKLVGCSNGLVCLAENNGKYFYLYNPFTNQSHKYYRADFDYWNSSCKKPFTCWGFGYVSSTDDFKEVRIILYQNSEVSIVHVYSLRSNIWSKVECCIEEGDIIIGQAHLVNETLYWCLVRGRNLAFDLAEEKFDFFPYLPINFHLSLSNNALCVMGGCLSKCSSYSENELKFEILKYPGREDSVAFSCDLDVNDCDQFFGFTKTGKVFFTRSNPGMLGLLDQSSKRTLATFDDLVFLIDPYTPTQRSPHPAAELPNVPPEGTWPVYQQLEPHGPVQFFIPDNVQLENPPGQADFIQLEGVQPENLLEDPADFIILEDIVDLPLLD